MTGFKIPKLHVQISTIEGKRHVQLASTPQPVPATLDDDTWRKPWEEAADRVNASLVEQNLGLEFDKVLVLSTLHIKQSTYRFVENNDVASDRGDYGFTVYVGGEWMEEYEEFPPDLKAAIDLARSHKCDYLRFDSDGPVTPLLKKEWVEGTANG